MLYFTTIIEYLLLNRLLQYYILTLSLSLSLCLTRASFLLVRGKERRRSAAKGKSLVYSHLPNQRRRPFINLYGKDRQQVRFRWRRDTTRT